MNHEAIIAAYLQCRRRYRSSVDTILCEPDQREFFLGVARAALGDVAEPALLRLLLNLRKRSKLPTEDLPTSASVVQSDSSSSIQADAVASSNPTSLS